MLLDFAPNWMRRRALAGEYEGEALEERLAMRIGGGWSMLFALWKMALVNRRPKQKVGDTVPKEIEVVSALPPFKKTSLVGLGRPGVPLLLNFGSCT